MAQTMAGANRDSAQFGAAPPPVVVNPPDPLNAGTLAETAEKTALAHHDTYP
jgi:hypothetical protein